MNATTTSKTVGEYAVNGAWSGRGDLSKLVAELQRQRESKIDFVADQRQLSIADGTGGLTLLPAAPQTREFIDGHGAPFLKQALLQLGERCEPNIPGRFLAALVEQQPGIAAGMLTDLTHANGKRRLFRCLDGSVRAVLSDSYRIMDNYDLAFHALDTVKACGGEVIEASLSDTHMRLKFTTRSVFDAINETRNNGGSWYAGGLGNQSYLSKVAARATGELPGGPGTVHPLVTISNSETGHGGLAVRVGLLRAICFNLAGVEDVAVKVHLGERMEAGVFTPETISAETKAIMLKARDAIKAAFEPDVFKRLVAKAHDAQADKIEAPQAAVQNIVAAHELGDAAKDSILAYFLRDSDSTRYGLAQAVARYAQDTGDAEAAHELELIAGKLIASHAALAV